MHENVKMSLHSILKSPQKKQSLWDNMDNTKNPSEHKAHYLVLLIFVCDTFFYCICLCESESTYAAAEQQWNAWIRYEVDIEM